MATDADGSGPNLIKAFKNAGVISLNFFAFALRSTLMASYLDIGAIDLDAMNNPADLVKIPIIPGNFWWAGYIDGVRFGDDRDNAFGMAEPQMAFTDSGTSCILVPT